MDEKTDLDLFSQWKRELQSADVEGFGKLYFYSPPSYAEMRPYVNGMSSGDVAGGILDSVIARVKRADGKPRWFKHHRTELEQLPSLAIYRVWRAIGADNMQGAGELAQAAEKK